jgi:hypothetical protein
MFGECDEPTKGKPGEREPPAAEHGGHEELFPRD